MPATQLPTGRTQFIDGNGDPYVGGTVGFYVPGTLNPKQTWQDANETIPNTNPIVLDALGSAAIWGTGFYRQILKDSSGNLIWDQVISDIVLSPVTDAEFLDLGNYVKPNGVTDNTAAITAAFSYAKNTGLSVIDFGNTYVISGDFVIDWNNFNFAGTPGKTIFLQSAQGPGFLRILGDYANVSGYTVQFTGTPANIPGTFRGESAWQRMCALWLEGSNTTFHDIVGINMRGGINFRGPVILIGGQPGNDNSQGTDLDARYSAVNNWGWNIKIYSADVAVSGNQQIGGGIDNVYIQDTTRVQGIAPHGIYMRAIQETTIYGGHCDNFTIGSCYSINNPYAEPFKIRNMQNCKFGPLSCSGTIGCAQITLIQNSILTIGTCDNQLSGGAGEKVIDLAFCTDVTVNMGTIQCAPQAALGAVRIRDASTGIVVNGGPFIESQTTAAEEIYSVTDTSNAIFNNIQHISQGVGKAFMIQVTGTGAASAQVNGVIQKSNGNLTAVGAGCFLTLNFNSAFVDNYSSNSISGPGVQNITDTRAQEGLWIPLIANQSGTLSPQTTETGNWARQGAYVNASFRAQVNGTTGFAGTDTIQLLGLPYKSAGSTGPSFFCRVRSVNVTPASGADLYAEVVAGDSPITLEGWLSQTRNNLTQAEITGTNARFDGEITYRTIDPFAAVPVCTTIPTISGTVQVGQVLTVTSGTWTNSPTSYTYLWFSDTLADLTAATISENIYTPTVNDVGKQIMCQVTAHNAVGSVAEYTAYTVAVVS